MTICEKIYSMLDEAVISAQAFERAGNARGYHYCVEAERRWRERMASMMVSELSEEWR